MDSLKQRISAELENINALITEGKSWHKDLLDLSLQENIITSECRESLGLYLAFRHYFSHGYALDLYHEKMEPLVIYCQKLMQYLKRTLINFISP